MRCAVAATIAATSLVAAGSVSEVSAATPVGVWEQLGADIGGPAGSVSGLYVAMSGDGRTVVVSDYHTDTDMRVRVLDWADTGWQQRGDSIDVADVRSVAMSDDGNTVIMGRRLDAIVAVWDDSTASWVQRGPTIASTAQSVAVSDDGNTVAIGSDYSHASTGAQRTGQVRIFDWDGSVWVQRGAAIDGAEYFDRFGYSLAMSGDGNTVVVGATGLGPASSDGDRLGRVEILDWDPVTAGWVQRGLDIGDQGHSDWTGWAVAVSDDGDTVIVGSPLAGAYGNARVFDWDADSTSWVQRGGNVAGPGPIEWSRSGSTVAISGDGDTVIVGQQARWGSARIHDWDADTSSWTQRGDALVGDATDDWFAYGVAMSADGDTVMVGAPLRDLGGGFYGVSRVYRFVLQSPETPTDVTATAPNPDEVVLAWTPGPNVDGFAVTGWQVEVFDDATAAWTTVVADTGTTTPTSTVPGLINGTEYVFRVSGISGAVVGDPTVSNPVVPTAYPTVSVAHAGGQDDPTNGLPIEFTVTFDQDVTGFDASGVVAEGSAGPSDVTVTVDPADAAVYTVSVAQVATDGLVEVSIAAAAAQATNANGQSNIESNTASVMIDTTGPVATIDLAAGQDATTGTTPVVFTVTFDEAVTDFDAADLAVSGTAGASNIVLTGSGVDYTITVGQAATSGTIVLNVPAGAATDALGNGSSTATVAATVTINDDTAPVIAIPAATVNASTDPGEAFATVDFTVTATDPNSTQASALTSGGVSAAFTGTVPVTCSPMSGSQFPIGSTTVTCAATDTDDNTATASFVVQVIDDEDPTITSPDDQSVQASSGGAVEYVPATATDNSGTATVTCAPAAGSTLPVGTSTVTCTATDPSGNTSAAAFAVTVVVPPLTNLPATGNSAIPWKHAASFVGVGLGLVLLAKRRRMTRTVSA